jgi:hypothetical protein
MVDIYFLSIILSLGTRVGENHSRSMGARPARARPAAGTACGPKYFDRRHRLGSRRALFLVPIGAYCMDKPYPLLIITIIVII